MERPTEEEMKDIRFVIALIMEEIKVPLSKIIQKAVYDGVKEFKDFEGGFAAYEP